MTGPRGRILVVDDEVLNRRLIQAILAPEGHEIIHAADGAQALERVAAGGVDLVLLDVMMPGIDGLEVCRRIRAEVGQLALPVVIISALTDPTSRTQAKELGADDFLTKPIHEDELLARVRNLLLLREYHATSERLRAHAERDARAWRIVSGFAGAVAGCLDYQSVSDAFFRHLADELAVEVVAYHEVRDGVLVPVAVSPGPAGAAELGPIGAGATVLPIVVDGEQRGAFCIGRRTPLDDAEVELLGRLSGHAGNAIATVRSHAATVAQLTRHQAAREEAEIALRHAQKMEAVGQLAGGVAHDFNNVLAAILGCTDLALEELGADHPVAADLKEIEAAAQRAAALTRQLLAFSRRQRREVKVVSLNAVVTNVEKMLSRMIGEDVAMAATLAPRLGSVEADVGQLEQVLINLVVNARDAMPAGGRLTIETHNADLDDASARRLGVGPGRYVVLAVSDTGCGMTEATQARVFEPFFTTKEVGRGTGLGLSTVFGIVEQSGGAIAIDSELGLGSTFRVYLPRIAAEPSRSPAPVRASAPMARGERVLLVEDDDALRAVICRQLASWGYQLIAARDASAALELLEQIEEPIDLLLTDLVMPGLDGRALAAEVLAERPSIKVLFMSGYTQHAAVRTAASSAADQFIEKPFTSRHLSLAVRRALEA